MPWLRIDDAIFNVSHISAIQKVDESTSAAWLVGQGTTPTMVKRDVETLQELIQETGSQVVIHNS